MVYWILLLLIYPTYTLFLKGTWNPAVYNFYGNDADWREKNYQRRVFCFCIVMAILLALINALKSVEVGIDTDMQLTQYEHINTLSSFKNVLIDRNEEHGYSIIMYCANALHLSFSQFVFVYSIFSLSVWGRFVSKYSDNPALSYFLFISMGIFTMCFMGTIRQSIALAITLLAYEKAVNKKFVSYLLLLVLAYTFHTSSLIFLPVYWLVNHKLKKHEIAAILLIVFSGYPLKNVLMDLAKPFLNMAFNTRENAGGELLYIFFLLMTILSAYAVWIDNCEDDMLNNFFYMIAITAFICPMLSANPAYYRAVYYYEIFIFLIIPKIQNKLDFKNRNIIRFLVLFVALFFMLTQVMRSSYYPYKFFWE